MESFMIAPVGVFGRRVDHANPCSALHGLASIATGTVCGNRVSGTPFADVACSPRSFFVIVDIAAPLPLLCTQRTWCVCLSCSTLTHNDPIHRTFRWAGRKAFPV